MTNHGNSHTGIGGAGKWVRNLAGVWLLSVPQLCFSFSFSFIYRRKAKLKDKPASLEVGSINCKCRGLLCESLIQNFKGNVKHRVNASPHQDFQMWTHRSHSKNLTDFCPSNRQLTFAPLSKDDAGINETPACLLRLGSSLAHLTPRLLGANSYRAETRQHLVDRWFWALQPPAGGCRLWNIIARL